MNRSVEDEKRYQELMAEQGVAREKIDERYENGKKIDIYRDYETGTNYEPKDVKGGEWMGSEDMDANERDYQMRKGTWTEEKENKFKKNVWNIRKHVPKEENENYKKTIENEWNRYKNNKSKQNPMIDLFAKYIKSTADPKIKLTRQDEIKLANFFNDESEGMSVPEGPPVGNIQTVVPEDNSRMPVIEGNEDKDPNPVILADASKNIHLAKATKDADEWDNIGRRG